MRFLSTCLLILFFQFNTYGQRDIKSDVDFQRLIDALFSTQDEDLNYEALYESLLLYYTHPIVINKATKDELRSLFLLSEAQINSLVTYREKFGPLLSIYELQAVPEFDLATIYKILPFVSIRATGLAADNRPLLRRILSEPNNYLLLRYERTFEEKKGYTESEAGGSRYIGSPDKFSARFRLSHARDFSIGLTAEKDAGESFDIDFFNFHFQLQHKGNLKNLVLGDYKIQFGQSLVLAAGFSVGKGAETITTTKRSNLGIRPYTSVTETNFFRGGAATYALHELFDLTVFYSRLKQDATVNPENTINGIKTSGLHRTKAEIASKDRVTHQTYGGNISYDKDNLQIGLTFVSDQFSLPFQAADQPYKRFNFQGAGSYNAGLSFNYTWQNISSFGEAARSASGGMGAVIGAMINLSKHLETSVVLRNYDRNFHSFHGGAFGEGSGNSNEQGWYWGLKYTPSRKYRFTAYFDRFVFPWLRFGVDAPSSGHEFLIRADYAPNRSVNFYAQFRQESKADNPAAEKALRPIKSPVNGIKRNYVFNLNYPLDKVISLKSRVLFSTYNFMKETTAGYAIMQDFNLDLGKFRISTRFALFDTDDYENRQYAYERDVLYGFSIPPYHGRGTRQYILLQYKLSRKMDIWARYARTHYRDRDKISSGLEEIGGDMKTDVKVQVRVRL